MDEEVKDMLDAYLAVSMSSSGDTMIRDLESAFILRENAALEEEMEQFPHPYRAYVEKGQQMVVQKIKAAIKLATESRAATSTNQEIVNDEH